MERALGEAERLLGVPLKEDCVDEVTGEVHQVVIVSDNGPAFKSSRFQLYLSSRPELRHVRTKYRSRQTNWVVERWFESVKYEHLFRLEIASGQVLAEETQWYRRLYNKVRPHGHLDFRTPIQAYLADPEPNLFTPRNQKT